MSMNQVRASNQHHSSKVSQLNFENINRYNIQEVGQLRIIEYLLISLFVPQMAHNRILHHQIEGQSAVNGTA